ncbi:hypothetical protein M9Y10_009915 [Tritrichomonas musculus]|uniref:Importin N-terminal domain-containing protein n=1 Tax=Tritrichomonas musculus TaxID=1915356 RepID=A0ABR2IPV0_9EUKA
MQSSHQPEQIISEQSAPEPTIYEAIINFAKSQNNEDIAKLNSFLTDKMLNSPLGFIRDIIIMLLDPSTPQQYSCYLLVHLSNAVSTHTHPIGFFIKQWGNIIIEVAKIITPPEHQIDSQKIVDSIHSRLIFFLNQEDFSIRVNASLCISRIIYFEIHLDLWNDFFPNLFSTLNNLGNNINLIDGSFRILISLIENDFIQPNMQKYKLIISSIYDLLKIYISSAFTDIKLRTLCFLMNSKSLHLLDIYLNQKEEITAYTQYLILNLSQIPDQTIHQLSYDILKSMFVRYTDSMNELMPNIYPYILSDIISDNAHNKVLAIDLWICIAMNEKDKRINILVKQCAPQLVPILLNFLISDVDFNRGNSIENNFDFDNDAEIEDEEQFSVINNSTFCLRCFVEVDSGIVVPPILKFIQENFVSPKDSLKIASLNAIYSVLKFQEFSQYLDSLMPNLISLIAQDENVELQSLALFITSKAISYYNKLISSADRFCILMSIVDKRIKSIIEISKTEEASNSNPERKKMMQISRNKKNLIIKRTFFLFSRILKCFVHDEMKEFLAQNSDLVWSMLDMFLSQYPNYRDEPTIIIEVFETITIFTSNLSSTSKEKINQILTFAYTNIQNEMKNTQKNYSTFIAMNCHLINRIVKKIKLEITPYVNDIMNAFYLLLGREDEEIFYETLTVIESFVILFKTKFQFYFNKLSLLLIRILETYQQRSSQRLTMQAIRVTLSIFQYRTQQLECAAEEYYNLISKILSSVFEKRLIPQQQNNTPASIVTVRPPFSKEILPYIIEAIGYITAASTKEHNEKFSDQLGTLRLAQKILIDLAVDEDKEFGYNLYESILACYRIIIQLPDDKYLVLKNHKQIIEAFNNMYKYSVMSKRSLDLFLTIIYELVRSLGFKFCRLLNEPAYASVRSIFDYIQNLKDFDNSMSDENLENKFKIVYEEIKKCLWLKDAYNCR